MPDSIFKLTNDDEDGTTKLKQFIKDIIKPAAITQANLKMSESASGFGQTSSFAAQQFPPKKVVEVRMSKCQLKRADEQNHSVLKEEVKEETKSIVRDKALQQKDIFNRKIILLLINIMIQSMRSFR